MSGLKEESKREELPMQDRFDDIMKKRQGTTRQETIKQINSMQKFIAPGGQLSTLEMDLRH